MYWAATSVGTLTRGYYSPFITQVKDTATRLENASKSLINTSLNLSHDEFNKALLMNAKKNFEVWRDLPGKLIASINNGGNIKYAKNQGPKLFRPKNYKDPKEDLNISENKTKEEGRIDTVLSTNSDEMLKQDISNPPAYVKLSQAN